MDDLSELRADIPALEPDPVLLAQLVELSSAGAAAPTARRPLGPVRALLTGVAALGLVATTSWIAGALPGVPSPIGHIRNPTPAPTSPATPDRTGRDARTPGAAPTSGASRPHTRAPGVGTTTASTAPSTTASASPSSSTAPVPTSTAASTPGHGEGTDQGRHLGQQKHSATPGPKETKGPKDPKESKKPHPTPGVGSGNGSTGNANGSTKGHGGRPGTTEDSATSLAPDAPSEGTAAGP